MRSRTRAAVRKLVTGMADPASQEEHRVPLPPVRGRWRLLVGMVLANRPWLLLPGLIPLVLLTSRRGTMGALVNRVLTTLAAATVAAVICCLNVTLIALTLIG